MKSFRNIIMEADDPSMVNALPDDKQASPAMDLEMPMNTPEAKTEAEGIENAADQVAAEIVDGEPVPAQDEQSVDAGANGEEVTPEEAPVASVDAGDGEPVASVDAPHEETPDLPEAVAAQATESCVIVQCGLIALNSAMKITEAVSTEAFLGSNDTISKKVVVEGFTDKVKSAWKKLVAFLEKIKNNIVNFIRKVVNYVKTLFARVYAKLSDKLHGSKAQVNWGRSAGKAKIKVKPLIKEKGMMAVEKGDAFPALAAFDPDSTLSFIKKSVDYSSIKRMTDSQISNFRTAKQEVSKFSSDKDIEVPVSAIFSSYNAAIAYIKDGYKTSIDKAQSDCASVIKACDAEITALKGAKPDDKPENGSAKVRLINMICSATIFKTNANVKILIKCIKYAGSAINAVAKNDFHVQESYINEDLMAFFNA